MEDRLAGAPIMDWEAATLEFGDGDRLACLYVIVDAVSRRDVADFLTGWHRCCDAVSVEWEAIRRPATALISLELGHCCGDDDGRIRLIFDAQRDAGALDTLAATEAIVVGSRRYGGFANKMAAYAIDGNSVRKAMAQANTGLRKLVSVG